MEYKDPIEEEWEKFQKVMQMENQVCNSFSVCVCVCLCWEDDRLPKQIRDGKRQINFKLSFIRNSRVLSPFM